MDLRPVDRKPKEDNFLNHEIPSLPIFVPTRLPLQDSRNLFPEDPVLTLVSIGSMQTAFWLPSRQLRENSWI